MTRQLRRVGLGLFALFGVLFANLNYLQVLQADELAEDNRNSRQLIREYDIQRGSIVLGAGAESREIARSEATDGRLRYLRVYPEGPLYAHVTGFYSYIYGREQVERTFNDFLIGSSPETFARNLADLFAGEERRGDDVVLTVRPAVQEAARDALGERRGAVVAVDPSSGEILALWSSPTYDPNLLASHDRSTVTTYWEQTETDPAKPRLSRATRELYPPGSTFKLVTAAAALAAGTTPDRTFPDPRAFDVPETTAEIRNFGGGLCNDGQPLDLRRALAVSCNTTFAQLGLEVGAEGLTAMAERFGLNQEWDAQIPVATSRIPKELDAPSTAQSAIGQRDVRVTPLQMAMIAATIANDGLLMTPQIARQVEDFAGRVLREYPPAPLSLPAGGGQVLPPEHAAALTDMMLAVVESGSGRQAAIPGVPVAGKTGTAQTGEGRPPTVWFVGFAPTDAPRVAVAVVVEDAGPGGDEATGGRIAAPIARTVMQAALQAAP